MRRRLKWSPRRRFRKAKRIRSRSVARKALSLARSTARKLDAEVKKLDVNAIITEDDFTGLSPAIGNAADNATSLPDFGYAYNLFTTNVDPDNQNGIALSDFIGMRVRAKYIYFGIHIQMPNRPIQTTADPF